MKRLILLALCLLIGGLTLFGQVTITPTSLPNGIVGSTYPSTTLDTSPVSCTQTEDCTWSVISGQMPPGVGLSCPTCLNAPVTGTPTVAGTYTFTIQAATVDPARNDAASYPTQIYTIVVYPTLTVTTTSGNSGSVSVPYSQTFTATGGAGATTYTWNTQTAPPPTGLTLSSAGVLSGTPTQTGTFTFVVQVNSAIPNYGMASATQSITVVISAVPPPVIGGTLTGGTVGLPYSATLGATGGYTNGTYTFSITDGNLPPVTGMSAGGTLSGTLAQAGTFTFTVQLASDRMVNGVQLPTLIGTEAFTVIISPPANPTIAGNLGAGTLANAYSATLGATGGYANGAYTFSVLTGNPPTGTTLSPGGTLSGTLTAQGTFNFLVQVASNQSVDGKPLPQLTGTQAFTVVISPPANPTITGSLGGGTVAVPYSATLGATGGYTNGAYTFSVIAGNPPSGTTLSASGTLSGTPTASGTYNFTVQAASNLSINGVALPTLTGAQAFTVVIAAPPNPIISGTLSAGAVGVPYSATLTASGGYGTGAYAFSVSSGTTPNGTTLSDHGTLAGTPTAAGAFNFTVQVSNTVIINGATFPAVIGTQTYSVVIYPTLTITTTSANSGSVGVPYSQTYAASGGAGASTYAWSFAGGTPPPGLTFTTAGLLSGTPTAPGTYSVYVQVSSQFSAAGSQFASQWFTIAISGTALPAINGGLSNGLLGVPYSAALMATGGYGAGTYTFSLASGTLPAGLSLSAAGTVSGTPTSAGTSTFTLQVTNTYPGLAANFPPLTGTQSFTLVIYPVLTITTVSLNPGGVGGAYSLAFTATGGAGTASYTWSLVSGTLPPGLTLSAAGVLSGAPTTAGNYVFTVQVSSQIPAIGAETATQGYGLAIGTVPSLSIAGSLSGGTVGVPYSATLTGFGGFTAGTYTFSLVSGTLPAGLTLSPGGTLSGTPTTVGASTFTLQVTSALTAATSAAGPLTATQAFTVTIYPPLAITPPAVSPGNVGGVYSLTLAATGGAGATSYTWSLVSGTLPPGLTLSTAGVLGGTPTSSGTFSFTAQVSSQVPTVGAQTANQSFTLTINPLPALTITGTLAAGVAGVPYSATLTGSGGYANGAYTVSLASGTLPPGVVLSSSGALSGTPTGTGTFNFTAQVVSTMTVATANLQPITAAGSFTIVITSTALTITGSPGAGTVGVPYSATLTGSGGYGTGTYTFSVVSGTLPPDVTLSAGGILSGTPTAMGTYTFTVQITSTQTTQPVTATQSFTITVGLAPAPPITISGLPNTLTPDTQPVLSVNAGSTYPIAIQGTITLTFAPVSGPDDPNVQFTTGGRTVPFQIPAGSSLALFTGGAPSVQTGTVAGTITLTLDFTAAGVDITPSPAPTQVLVIPKSAPVITSVTVTAVSGGFNLVVVGYSTTRDMTSALVTFTPTSGVTLGSNTATVSLSQIFTTWYQSATSAQFGSMFLLEIPFSIQNGTNPLASVSIALTNSIGTSAAATATF